MSFIRGVARRVTRWCRRKQRRVVLWFTGDRAAQGRTYHDTISDQDIYVSSVGLSWVEINRGGQQGTDHLKDTIRRDTFEVALQLGVLEDVTDDV